MYKLRSVVKHKKAGLDVSVNSIVILIFAVIILGLGIKFIQNMFNKTSQSFNQISQQAQRSMQQKLATSSKRIILSDDQFTLAPGKSTDAYLGIKNYLGSEWTFEIYDPTSSGQTIKEDGSPINPSKSTISCYYMVPSSGSSEPSSYWKLIKFQTVPEIKLDSGKSAIRKIIISAAPTAVPGTYYCEWYVTDPSQPRKAYSSFSFNVEVTPNGQ